jgi:hypothetical protein
MNNFFLACRSGDINIVKEMLQKSFVQLETHDSVSIQLFLIDDEINILNSLDWINSSSYCLS